MENKEFNEDEELEKIKAKKNELTIAEKVNNSISQYYDESIAKKEGKIKQLTDDLVDAEFRVNEKKIIGRERVLKNKIEQDVTKSQSELEQEKHEQSKTILKAQGLTEKLPTAFRKTAIALGYPFFVLYLITLGWIIEFVTFVVKGIITMAFDCARKYAELNKEFTSTDEGKKYNVKKAIFDVIKLLLIVGAVITILVLLVKR